MDEKRQNSFPKAVSFREYIKGEKSDEEDKEDTQHPRQPKNDLFGDFFHNRYLLLLLIVVFCPRTSMHVICFWKIMLVRIKDQTAFSAQGLSYLVNSFI